MITGVDDDVLEAEWRSLTRGDVQRAIEQVRGSRDIPGELLDLIAQSFQVRPGRPVRFQVQRRQLGATAIAGLLMPEIQFRGLPFQAARTVHVGFVVQGAVTIAARDGATATLGPGEACVISNWSLFDVSCLDDTRVIHVLIPEPRLLERGVRVRPQRFRLEGPRTMQAPIVALASALLDPEWRPTTMAVRVAEQALESLVVGLLIEHEDRELDRREQHDQLRRRAVEEIALRHRDPELTPRSLAKVLGVSLRHLQRGFENSGTTISQCITTRRAESAAALLVAPHGGRLTVPEIARAAGFGSAYELRSAFRARYGVLPSGYRDRILTPASE